MSTDSASDVATPLRTEIAWGADVSSNNTAPRDLSSADQSQDR